MSRIQSFRTVIIGFVVATGLVSCANSDSNETPSTTTVTSTRSVAPTTEEDIPAAPSRTDTAKDLYTDVLDNPGHYNFQGGADYDLTGQYQYALIEMTGDDIPELLLVAESADYISPVRVFSTSDDGTLLTSDDTLVSGASSGGGYRARVAGSPEGNQIFQVEGNASRMVSTARGFILEGDRLVTNGVEFQDSMTAPSQRLSIITYHPVSDRNALETIGQTSTQADTQVFTPQPTLGEDPSAGGYTASGTIRVMTAPQLARHQGLEATPNGEDDTYRFAVLIFDSPTMFTAPQAGNPDGPIQREAKMVLLGEQTPHRSNNTAFDFDGQRATITYLPEECGFPSDASLPLGAPRCGGVSIN